MAQHDVDWTSRESDSAHRLYDKIGSGYSAYRRADPRIAALILNSLGNSASVVNVGAGTGSYEPQDRRVVAVEPSETMIAQRPPRSAPAVRASAMALPFRDGAFDTAMAVLTIHHWPDRDQGIAELKRASRDKVLILTWEPPETPFWLMADYLPHFFKYDLMIFPQWWPERQDTVDVISVPIPHDCTDGFLCAYWRRPEAYLDPNVRNAISTFSRFGGYGEGIERLRREIADGEWDRQYGYLRSQDAMDFGYRIVLLRAR